MSNIHKSTRAVIIDMLNDTSEYLDDIFTIDYPEFEKHIPAICMYLHFVPRLQ